MWVLPLILFFVGGFLNLTIVGAIIGVPLCTVSFIWFIVAVVRSVRRERRRQEKREDERTAMMAAAIRGEKVRNAANSSRIEDVVVPSRVAERREEPAKVAERPREPDSIPLSAIPKEHPVFRSKLFDAIAPEEKTEERAAEPERHDTGNANEPPEAPVTPSMRERTEEALRAGMAAADSLKPLIADRIAPTVARIKTVPVWPFLYGALAIAAVMFIPEAREWTTARVGETWQWVQARSVEGQARGAALTSAAHDFATAHFTVISQIAALVALAALFVRFGKKAGIAGALGCVLVAGYLAEREYESSDIIPSDQRVPSATPIVTPSPSPIAVQAVPSPTPPNAAQLDTKALCKKALSASQDSWDQFPSFQEFVTEAKLRGLAVGSCRSALGIEDKPPELSDMEICQKALNLTKDDWDTQPQFIPFVQQAQGKGFSVNNCRFKLGLPDILDFANMSDQDLCRASLNANKSDWNNEDYLEKARSLARSKNFTVDSCRALFGLQPVAQVAVKSNPAAERLRPDTLLWTIIDNSGEHLVVAFYSQTRANIGWPAWDKNWTLHSGVNTFNLQCQPGETICFGAWDNQNPDGHYWGVGMTQRYSCPNCCAICNGIRINNMLPPVTVTGD